MKYVYTTNKIMLTSVLTFLLTACGEGGGGANVSPSTPQTLTEIDTKLIQDCNLPSGQTLTLSDRNSHVDYIIDCNYVAEGNLIIEKNVTIEFGTGAGIEVDGGSLQAKGTNLHPVILTGIDKSKGAWKGIFIDSADVKNKLDYVQIDYAGRGSFNSNGDEGAVIVYAGGLLNMSNSSIRNSKTYGLNVSYKNADLTLKDNTITSSDAPMYLRPQYVTSIVGGTYTENTRDAIIVNSYTSAINNDSLWRDLGVPYRVEDKLDIIAGGGKLTIEPGVTIEFGADAELFVNEGASGSKPSLIAVGTAAKPITFTGIDKVKGAWKGIYFDSPSPLNEIAYANIDYASNGNQVGAVFTWYGTVLKINNVIFNHIKYDAIHVKRSLANLPTVTVTNTTYNDIGGSNFKTTQ